jgi:16S rRNA (guanine(966)-N(2))-methyltransferase RsmD
MRVIAGEFRSRRINGVPGLATRPTPDRLRESLFSILAPRIAGAVFLDAYAGSGSVGIEALSRGAARAIFLESNRAAGRVLVENLRSLDVENRAEVILRPALSELAQRAADIVFLDPPYALSREYTLCLQALAQVPPKLILVQHDVRLKLPEHFGQLRQTRVLRQGDNAISFYEPAVSDG